MYTNSVMRIRVFPDFSTSRKFLRNLTCKIPESLWDSKPKWLLSASFVVNGCPANRYFSASTIFFSTAKKENFFNVTLFLKFTSVNTANFWSYTNRRTSTKNRPQVTRKDFEKSFVPQLLFLCIYFSLRILIIENFTSLPAVYHTTIEESQQQRKRKNPFWRKTKWTTAWHQRIIRVL